MGRMIMVLSAVALSVLLGVGHAFALGKAEMERETVAVGLAREVVNGGYALVTTAELKRWVDENRPMLLVDANPYEDGFKKMHIPKAVNFPFPKEEVLDLDAASRARYEALLGPDKGRLIVIYCSYTKCGRSHNGAVWARKLGYTNVIRHPGGLNAWREADYPVEKGR